MIAWDGNPSDSIGGPDFSFLVGIEYEDFKNNFFFNSPVYPPICLYQSYPNTYFRQIAS